MVTFCHYSRQGPFSFVVENFLGTGQNASAFWLLLLSLARINHYCQLHATTPLYCCVALSIPDIIELCQ